MDIEEFRTKPSWEAYEAVLLRKGFTPCFEPQEEPLPVTWCRCGAPSAYVVMTDGRKTLGLADVRAPLSDFVFKPTVHLNYEEAVLPMRDGLPKLRDFPEAIGGTGQTLPE